MPTGVVAPIGEHHAAIVKGWNGKRHIFIMVGANYMSIGQVLHVQK